jgi:alpha/beta superfamily hydrolase
LLLVAPPVSLFDFSELPEVDIPWMVIQGGKDEVIAPEAVSRWLQQRKKRPLLRWMADADHFFHGRLNRVRETVMKLWAEAMPEDVAK